MSVAEPTDEKPTEAISRPVRDNDPERKLESQEMSLASSTSLTISIDKGNNNSTESQHMGVTSYSEFRHTMTKINNKTVPDSRVDTKGQASGLSNGSDKQNKPGNIDASTGGNDGTREKLHMVKRTSTPTTTSLARFKEKRPEPLKLNPNLNQETPLDLSVKSAGNVPSGPLSSIFNLGSNNHMTTLETPRIQWQDNDALLATGKSRSFSSSTNASQHARISSLIGESPPITPGSPSTDMIAKSQLKPINLPDSASFVMDTTSINNSLNVDSPNEYKRSGLNNGKQYQSNKTHSGLVKLDNRHGPRRSCSTDDLNMGYSIDNQRRFRDDRFVKQLKVTPDESGGLGKKNSISPLVIKSLSNVQNGNDSSKNFSYSNQQISASNQSDTQKSPTLLATVKSLTPTSVANATANLLNIHLNSPTGGNSLSPTSSYSDMGSIGKNHYSKASSVDHESSPLDPLISAAYCQQQQIHQNQSNLPMINFSTPSMGFDHHNHNQHSTLMQHHAPAISSSATLNTPTLISPSQLKAGHLCFLPSPTLSPMSSVFDLPSPFLGFPQNSTTNHHSAPNGNSRQSSPRDTTNQMDTSFEVLESKNNGGKFDGIPTNLQPNKRQDGLDSIFHSVITTESTGSSLINENEKSLKMSRTQNNNDAPEISDMSNIIMSAASKTMLPVSTNSTDKKHNEDDVEMDIDLDFVKVGSEDHLTILTEEKRERPATVIPQICISDHQASSIKKGQSSSSLAHVSLLSDENSSAKTPGQRNQRNTTIKRSFSPRSSRFQVSNNRSDRLGSNSAPPEFEQSRTRSKLKTIGDSCFDLVQTNEQDKRDNHVKNLTIKYNLAPTLDVNDINRSHSGSTTNQHSWPNKLYPDICELFPSSNQRLLQTHGYFDQYTSAQGVRASSAEPALYTRVLASKVNHSSSVNNTENISAGCYQSHGHLFQDNNLSQSTQQLHIAQHSGIQKLCNPFGHSSVQANCARSRYNDNGYQQANQQSLHHTNSVNFHYYAQQHSVSTGELHKIPNQTFNHRQPMIETNCSETNGSVVESSQYCTTQRGTIVQPTLSSLQQFSQQPTSNSLNRVDCLSNSYQQTSDYQRRQQSVNNVIADSSSSTRSVHHDQGSVMNLICNGESCQQPSPHINNLLQRHGSNPLIPLQHPMETLISSTKLSGSLQYSYQIDIESRSESRSNSPMDFPSPYIESGSRPNSTASSNLAAKKYPCDMCSKSFTRSDMLTRHRRLHSGDRPFQCGECKQEFSRSDHLSTHMRTHTGEKPYKCKMCSYSACRKDMITRHLKVHSRSFNETDII